MTPALAHWTRGFEAEAKRVNGGAGVWPHTLRAHGFATFQRLGWPTAKDEAWKHTSLKSLAPCRFDGGAAPAPEAAFFHKTSLRLSLLDGLLSRFDAPPSPIICRLEQAARQYADQLRPLLGSIAQEQFFAAVNTALFRDGLFVFVPDGLKVAQPLELAHIGSAAEQQSRVLVVLGRGASLHLIERFTSATSTELTNSVTEIALGPHSELTHVRVLDEAPTTHHIGTLAYRLEQHSRLKTHLFAMGGKLARTGLDVRLVGEHATAEVAGLALTQERQQADLTSIVDHAEPSCRSAVNFRTIVGGQASAIFNAKVVVRPHAQKSDATQHNRNLVLSPSATAYTRPQLEIYANDVKCAHGATVGQLDADQLFYLRSRGISAADARRELAAAFAREIFAGLGDAEVAGWLEATLRTRLGGEDDAT